MMPRLVFNNADATPTHWMPPFHPAARWCRIGAGAPTGSGAPNLAAFRRADQDRMMQNHLPLS